MKPSSTSQSMRGEHARHRHPRTCPTPRTLSVDRAEPRQPAIRATGRRCAAIALPQIRTFVKLGFAVIDADPSRVRSDGRSMKRMRVRAGIRIILLRGSRRRDVLAAVRYAQTLPQVDRNRVVLVGQSAGGFASLAAASHAPQGWLQW